MAALNYFPARVAFVNPDGTLTPVAQRSWNELVNRTGGVLGNAGNDTFVSQDFSAVESGQSAGGDVSADVFGASSADVSLSESVTQPLGGDSLGEMVMQPLQDRAMTAPEPISVTASPFTSRAGRDGLQVLHHITGPGLDAQRRKAKNQQREENVKERGAHGVPEWYPVKY
jgi:hypothetical protein